MNNCGPSSQCKTNRCHCKKNNQLCKQNCPNCKCTNINCANRSHSRSSDDEDYPNHLNDSRCNCQKGKCKSNTNCGCIKSNERCNQKCKCIDCENKNRSQLNTDAEDNRDKHRCQCKTSKCKSSRCSCASLNKQCSKECKCINCENTNQSELFPEHDEKYIRKFECRNNKFSDKNSMCIKNSKYCSSECNCSSKCLNQSSNELTGDLNELASSISQKIRVPVTNKKDVVFEFRNNIDLYTRVPKADVENPQVDHIIEDQLVGHAAAHVLQGKQSFEPYLNVLKKSVNLESLDNYNVTFGSINASKGSILRRYLRDNINKGFPLRALIDPGSHFGKNMEPIFQVMNNTHEIVEEYIAEGRRSDGHITGNDKYKDIAGELSNIFREMKLDVNEERKTRISNRK